MQTQTIDQREEFKAVQSCSNMNRLKTTQTISNSFKFSKFVQNCGDLCWDSGGEAVLLVMGRVPLWLELSWPSEPSEA
jgi:hypothetical protein